MAGTAAWRRTRLLSGADGKWSGFPMVNDPAFAMSRIERITGLNVHISYVRKHYVLVSLDTALGRQVVSCAPTLAMAVRQFLDENLRQLRVILACRQRERCAICGLQRALELDHKTLRSQRRDDRIDNLQLLCGACHRQKHGASGVREREGPAASSLLERTAEQAER
jgi:hypothetical protein